MDWNPANQLVYLVVPRIWIEESALSVWLCSSCISLLPWRPVFQQTGTRLTSCFCHPYKMSWAGLGSPWGCMFDQIPWALALGHWPASLRGVIQITVWLTFQLLNYPLEWVGCMHSMHLPTITAQQNIWESTSSLETQHFVVGTGKSHHRWPCYKWSEQNLATGYGTSGTLRTK